MNNSWLEVSCDVSPDLVDIVTEYLTDLSGTGVCVENINVDAFSHSEIIHAPIVTIKAYFSAEEDMVARLAEINACFEEFARQFPEASITEPVLSTVKTEDWSTSWKSNFKPLRIGRHLLIIPTWEEQDHLEDDIVLNLDPGMAFGTGGHETTRLCLELLEQIMEEQSRNQPPSLLDLGTGSGILAIAAAKLGAGRICATDIDPQAIEVALDNMAINNLNDRIECSTTPIESMPGQFDIILANILAEELVRLAEHISARLEAGGQLVLSGILAEKEELVRNGFANQPLKYIRTERQGEWIAMLYKMEARP